MYGLFKMDSMRVVKPQAGQACRSPTQQRPSFAPHESLYWCQYGSLRTEKLLPKLGQAV